MMLAEMEMVRAARYLESHYLEKSAEVASEEVLVVIA